MGPKRRIVQFLRALQSWMDRQEGVALIIALLVMLVLVLLGISLLLQSSTEHLIAVNEQDSITALGDAEAALHWAKQIVRAYVTSCCPRPADLTGLLVGPDGIASTGDDNLLGLRDLSLSSTSSFNTTNEQTASAIVTRNFGDGNKTYEVFRMSPGWSGPRAQVYIRIDDNFDDGSTQNTTDTDLRIRATAIAEYPIFVDSSGNEETDQERIAGRGRARRILVGRFSPIGSVALRTDTDLNVEGGSRVCGECGSIHANGDLAMGGTANACGQATSSGGSTYTAGVTVSGDRGFAPEIYIPVINPYDNKYVPTPATFNHTGDANYLLTDASIPATVDLRCPAPTSIGGTDPGSSKYFALIFRKVSGTADLQVWKAYWDADGTAPDNRWVWRLIDQKLTGVEHLDAQVDNCGRVVSGHMIALGTEDPCPPGAVACGGCGVKACNGVDDSQNAMFYGFNASHNFATVTCTQNSDLSVNTHDASLDAIPYNNGGQPENVNDFQPNTIPTYAGESTTNVPLLPSSPIAVPDGNKDLLLTDTLGNTDATWGIAGNTVFTPMFGAVIWIFGNANLSGNLSLLGYNNGAGTLSMAIPNSIWRVAVISYGYLDAGGTTRYSAPHRDVYDYGFVAGRDMRMHGNPGTGTGAEVCPPSATDCAAAGSVPAGYEGIFVAHEEVQFNGLPGIVGFVIAEGRATCSDFNVDPTHTYGSNPAIRYDCDHPIDPWVSESTTLRDWEEVQ